VSRPDIHSGGVPGIVVLRHLLLALRRHLRGIWSARHASRSQFFALTVIFGFRRLISVPLLFSVHDALIPPDVGGVLGMGDHYVAVRLSAIKLSYDAKDKKWHTSMDANADQLKAAPEFKYPSRT